MTTIAVVVSSLLALSRAQGLLKAKCNYAAPASGYGGHPYPIGVCSSDRTANGTETSFKFMCNDNGLVDLEEYDDLDCSGTAMTTTDLVVGDGNDADLTSFECGMDECDYAMSCSYGSCGTNTSDPMVTTCANCVANPENYEVQCQAFITNQCYGNAGVYKWDTCGVESIFVDTLYFGTNCSDPLGFALENGRYGGLSPEEYCVDENYYGDNETNHFYHTVECFSFGTTMPPQTTMPNDSGANMHHYGLSVVIVLIGLFSSKM